MKKNEIKEVTREWAKVTHDNELEPIIYNTEDNDRTTKIKWQVVELSNKYNEEDYKYLTFNATHTDGEKLTKELKQIANALRLATLDKLKGYKDLTVGVEWVENDNGKHYRQTVVNISQNSECYYTNDEIKKIKQLIKNVVAELNATCGVITELHILNYEYQKHLFELKQKKTTYDRKNKRFKYVVDTELFKMLSAYYTEVKKSAKKPTTNPQKKTEEKAKARAKAKEENAKPRAIKTSFSF